MAHQNVESSRLEQAEFELAIHRMLDDGGSVVDEIATPSMQLMQNDLVEPDVVTDTYSSAIANPKQSG